ncbi:MAG: helix-turn-helix domain-containing protein [Pseudomonadales bacterium]|jgi:transcriptional regulator with XRE-family HTH domain|nr:helix-turn-helix domain-containing protein [Pseudomonadales bacterium]
MKEKALPSIRATAELAKLGADIAVARKRRRFTQQRLADGAGVNVATIRRLERGDAGVSLGVLAMVLLTLGESGRLEVLLDAAKDDIGLVLGINELPQRVRSKGRGKAQPRLPQAHGGSREPEAF